MLYDLALCYIVTYSHKVWAENSVLFESSRGFNFLTTGEEIVYCQRLSCFGCLVDVLERDTNTATAYIFLKKYLIFIDPYLCCEMQSCTESEMLLNCVVFPTQQTWKYYNAIGMNRLTKFFSMTSIQTKNRKMCVVDSRTIAQGGGEVYSAIASEFLFI